MSELTDTLEALLSEHRRIGSPVPDYLRPGASIQEVTRGIADAVGVEPHPDLVELYTWHDGFDYAAWQRDVAPGFTRLFGDTFFAPIGEAIDSRTDAIRIDETKAEYAEPGEAPQSWKPSWFPAFCRGWEDYAVECEPGPAFGRVYLPSWQPPPGLGPGPRFRDLQHLAQCAVRRFQSDAYWWDRSDRFLKQRWEILDLLFEREIGEARA